jgi:hypothetical protein
MVSALQGASHSVVCGVMVLAVGTGVVVIVVAIAVVLLVLIVSVSMRGGQKRGASPPRTRIARPPMTSEFR